MRIVNATNPGSPSGNLDLFTSSLGTTHVVWDGSGAISGQNSRFEQYANSNGFYFNAVAGTGRYLFTRNNIETGRIGINNFWRVGLNPANVDADRRLEVFDAANVAQFRITQS